MIYEPHYFESSTVYTPRWFPATLEEIIGTIKVWTGSTWTLAKVKVHNGTNWIERTLKTFNGSTWE